MKVVVDLVDVLQRWNPDTMQQRNYVRLRFGAEEVEVPCSETAVQAIIASAAQQHVKPEGSGAEDYEQSELGLEDLPTNVEGDHVFGGDVGPPQHSLFDTSDLPAAPEERPATQQTSLQQRLENIQTLRKERPSQQRKDAKAAMRERARAVPHRRVAKDDLGYPVVTAARPAARSIQAPVVQIEEIRSSVEVDDGFEQG